MKNQIKMQIILEEKTGFKKVTDTDATTLCYRNYVREIHNEPELNIDFDKSGVGITLYKSKPPIIPEDKRYILVTANL